MKYVPILFGAYRRTLWRAAVPKPTTVLLAAKSAIAVEALRVAGILIEVLAHLSVRVLRWLGLGWLLSCSDRLLLLHRCGRVGWLDLERRC